MMYATFLDVHRLAAIIAHLRGNLGDDLVVGAVGLLRRAKSHAEGKSGLALRESRYQFRK
jgi:hypothetical protein